MSPLICQLIFCGILALIIRKIIQGRKSRLPPGPFKWPIIGNVFELYFANPNHPHLAMDTLSKKYGDIMSLNIGAHPFVVISSLETFNEILTKDEASDRYQFPFVKERGFNQSLGVIWSNGDRWKEMRRFMLRKLREFGLGKRDQMDGIIVDELCDLLTSMKNIIRQSEEKGLVKGGGAIFHMDCYFAASVVNVLWRMMVGKRYDLENQRVKKILELNFKVVDAIALNNLCITYPYLSRWLPEFSGYNNQKKIFTELQEFMKDVICQNRAKLDRTMEPSSFLDYFIREMDANAHNPDTYFTVEELVVILKDMFLGGSETSSHTLSFTIYFMAMHQDVQKRIQSEIANVIPSGMHPSLSDLPRMFYTQATMLEILRCGLVIPLPASRAAKESFTFRNYDIPKGTGIAFNLYSVFQDKKLWGDPELFRPDRFLDENNKVINTSILPAFGMGKRNCSGESLARSTFFHYLVTLLQHFDIETVPNNPPSTDLKPNSHTLSPKPFDVIFKIRADAQKIEH